MQVLSHFQFFLFVLCSPEWLSNVLVLFLMLVMHLQRDSFFILTYGQVFFQELNDIQVRTSNFKVVVFDVLVFLLVALSTSFDGLIFGIFNLLNFVLTFLLHLLAESAHPGFVLELDFVTDSLMVTTNHSHLFIV
jgi:hypothetical protein